MNELIREIRVRLQCSQERFAADLGVSPVTVSRWENGRSRPGGLAEQRIFELCGERQLDMADFIVENGRGHGEGQVLYHASRTGIEGTIRPISRSRCDFGRAFYMGSDPLQPLTLVCNEDNPVFYALSFDREGLDVLDVEMGMDWAMLIALYRGYLDDFSDSPLYRKCVHMTEGRDAIAGFIADDRMYQVLTDFFEQRITDEALLGALSALKLGRQYAAVTQRACDRISILREKELSGLELLFLKERSTVRRREGLAVADGIVKDHRRDGRYFDEIMRGERA